MHKNIKMKQIWTGANEACSMQISYMMYLKHDKLKEKLYEGITSANNSWF